MLSSRNSWTVRFMTPIHERPCMSVGLSGREAPPRRRSRAVVPVSWRVLGMASVPARDNAPDDQPGEHRSGDRERLRVDLADALLHMGLDVGLLDQRGDGVAQLLAGV